eukprot:6023291-Pyramimonas_sp.AAC.1
MPACREIPLAGHLCDTRAMQACCEDGACAAFAYCLRNAVMVGCTRWWWAVPSRRCWQTSSWRRPSSASPSSAARSSAAEW